MWGTCQPSALKLSTFNEYPKQFKDKSIFSGEASYLDGGYKNFFHAQLILAEHEICPADRSQITNNCKFFHAKHS